MTADGSERCRVEGKQITLLAEREDGRNLFVRTTSADEPARRKDRGPGGHRGTLTAPGRQGRARGSFPGAVLVFLSGLSCLGALEGGKRTSSNKARSRRRAELAPEMLSLGPVGSRQQQRKGRNRQPCYRAVPEKKKKKGRSRPRPGVATRRTCPSLGAGLMRPERREKVWLLYNHFFPIPVTKRDRPRRAGTRADRRDKEGKGGNA